MKLFVKFLIFIVVLALCGPFFIKGPDGRPLWTVRDTMARARSLFADAVGQVNTQAGDAVDQAVNSNEVTVYRWRDESGEWHFAAQPPGGKAAEAMQIDTKNNAIRFEQPVRPPSREESSVETSAPVAESPMMGPLPSPEATRQLIDDVRELQDMADERLKMMESIE